MKSTLYDGGLDCQVFISFGILYAMISVTILTKNNELTLRSCLEALRAFPEIIILDNGSTDQTLAIAAEFPNVKIFTSPFIGFGPLHNLATSYASHDWILSLDSDEVLSSEAAKEILEGKWDPRTVYQISSHNYFQGKRITCCGWSPDYKYRFYHRAETGFSNDQVHESVQTKGMRTARLAYPIYHYSYHSVEDFLKKMQTYSTLFAEQNAGTRESSLLKAYGKSWAAFFRCYILKRGILGGREGYLLSKYYADVAFYKYMKLFYKNQKGENHGAL